jgi:hypothetical protein
METRRAVGPGRDSGKLTRARAAGPRRHAHAASPVERF